MSSEPTDEKPVERLTVDEWLKRTNELGYYLTKPHVRYEAKGWKAVAEFAGLLFCFFMFFGLLMGGVMLGGAFYDSKHKCEARHE